MSFQGKYQILSARSDGECQPFRALQISTGQPVLVHHLPAGETPPPQPDLESLIVRFLRITPAEESRHFLDMGEDEGRIFVVTADVPECLDLRQWLQSAIEAQAGKEGDTQAREKSPYSGNIEFTQNFTREALRQVVRSAVSAPIPPSPGPGLVQPPLPPAEKGPGVLMPPPNMAAVSSEVTDHGPANFSGFWDKSAPASLGGQSASFSTPPDSSKSPDGSSEVTTEFFSVRSSPSAPDAPTVAMNTLQAQAAARRRPPAALAGPAEARGNVGRFADLVPTHPEVRKPPVAPSEVEVSYPAPQLAATPAAPGSETKTPLAITGLWEENNRAQPQAAASASSPNAYDNLALAEKVPRRQMPMGFEVVFQSSKPRSRPTLSGLPPDNSGIMAAPVPIAPPDVTPTAGKIGGSPAIGTPWASGEQRQAVGAKKDLTAPPWAPVVQKGVKESEQATRLVPTPPVPSAKPGSPAPPGESVSTGRAMPPISAPRPTPPNRAQPGEYTQMIENIKAVAGPLSLGVSPDGYQPAANRAVPAPAPAQAPYSGVPAFQPPAYSETPPQFRPSVSLAYATPSHSAGKKRRVWVPVIILSSLFLMTTALLLFFALKR